MLTNYIKKSGSSRNYYYKIMKNGKKKQISKEAYEKGKQQTKTKKMIEHVSEPWYTLISLGLKTVEGRRNKGKFKELAVGDIIEWKNDDFKPRSVQTRVIGKVFYPTFAAYLEGEGLQKCLPGMPSLEHGLSVYYKYYTKADEAEFGVIAIQLALV